MVLFDEDKQNKQVKELWQKEEEELAKMLSQKYGIGYVDLSGISINSDALRLIPEEKAKLGKMAAFRIVGKRLSVAIKSLEDKNTNDVLDDLKEKDYHIEIYLTSEQSLEKAWGRYKDLSFAMETKAGTLDISNEEIQTFLEKVQTLEDVKKLIDENLTVQKVYRTSKLLGIIVAGALSTEASDIHIEPEESYTRLRYRLDGVLVSVLEFDKETYELILSRIKLLSSLKLNIKSTAQDGRFSVKIYNNDIEIRTSVLPGAYGESVVMRILNPQSIKVTLEELGIPEKLLEIFKKEIAKPNGMILNTGPTGSGKTTTLYAFLRKVHTPGIKIITIEDPIEYHLPGIVQTQTEPEKNYTFATGLRSALRQDPDIIMVGEIRDGETAEIAIQAAETGHLVFSTLHTNTAAGTFPRLLDLGANSTTLASAINIAIAQRLLRKVCISCAKKTSVPENRKEEIKMIIENIKSKEGEVLQDTEMYEAVGCSECHNTGYKGRIGIYEAILKTKEIEEAIRDNRSEREIALLAEKQNILTLAEDGIKKVLEGITTLDELERIVDINDEIEMIKEKNSGAKEEINS